MSLASEPNPRILLVDDHPPNLLALEAILEGVGAEFVRAASGEEALRRLLHGEFALILLDVQMPGIDGFETAALIRQREATRGIPIIFLTAIHRDPSQQMRGYDQGAVDYLLKPFDAHVLRSKVSVFLELHRARERIRKQEQRLLEQERQLWEKRTRRRYRDLTDAMPNAVWAAEADGTIYYFNRAFTDYAGRIGPRAPQSALIDRMHPEDRDACVHARATAIATGQPCETTFRMKNRDGGYRAFLERIFVERDEDGTIVGIVGALTDIEDLRRAADEKDAFLAAATHELRTPVAAGMAVLQLALRRLNAGRDVDAKEVLNTVQDQVRRMAKLVDDLLDATRLARGALPLEISKHDLVAIARAVRDRFASLEPERALDLRAPESLPAELDASRIDQVITNLVSNALRYSPPGSPIEVILEDLGDEARLSVRDLGVGVPRDRQQAIFGRFARAHGTRYGGLGLGLDIALGIVRQHGGEISVESDGVAGRGSTFHVRLPRHSVEAKRETARTPATAPSIES
jgi:PAS domain S-box-containing protein